MLGSNQSTPKPLLFLHKDGSIEETSYKWVQCLKCFQTTLVNADSYTDDFLKKYRHSIYFPNYCNNHKIAYFGLDMPCPFCQHGVEFYNER